MTRDTPHFRPALHFTPAAHWMNDPNGLVFHDGVYHLFFQYHPHSLSWGPMHWGHASSTDLLHWQEHPIALAPDALGMIFSGSVVIDEHNTSGLGPDGSAPWVAVFTHHDDEAAKAGNDRHESQSLAVSLDHGQTWHKYAGNPVLPTPGPRDFRDPKVFWHPDSSQWVLSLAVGDHVAFYGSPDLKAWVLLSSFGHTLGAHGGVWECPDLFPLSLNGRVRWVLLVSLNPGGPNGGSATQYFIGDFDGRHFVPESTATRWIDRGPDSYAGVTWSKPGPRKTFIAWMSNWAYGRELPTSPWRSAMTLPRDLALHTVDGVAHLASWPAAETLDGWDGRLLADAGQLSAELRAAPAAFLLSFDFAALGDFTLTLSNASHDALQIGFDAAANTWFIDRSRAGEQHFHPGFAGRSTAPRVATEPASSLLLAFDRTSVELFADSGLNVMTALFFPREPFTRASLSTSGASAPGPLMLNRRAGSLR